MSQNKSHHRFTQHLSRLMPAILFMAFSLYLLFWAGQRQAENSYPQLQMQRLVNHGQQIKRTMESLLKAGAPLEQFVGFSALSTPLLQTDSWLDQVSVKDKSGRIIFANSASEEIRQDTSGLLNFQPEQEPSPKNDTFDTSVEQAKYQVSFPLENKFEVVGELTLSMPKVLVGQAISREFGTLKWIFLALTLLFGILLYVLRIKRENQNQGLLLCGFIIFMMGAAFFENRALQNLNSDGLFGNIQSLTEGLALRLEQIKALGLNVTDFSGIAEELTQVRDALPGVEYISLVDGPYQRVHTEPDEEGNLWEPKSSYHEYRANLRKDKNEKASFVVIGVSKDYMGSRRWETFRDNALKFLGALLLISILLWLVDFFIMVGFKSLVIPATCVMSLSFVLLFYVGIGEAYRTYPKLQLEKVAAQGETVKQNMETLLKAGVPLKQFVGFASLTQTIMSADPSIQDIRVQDTQGNQVFLSERQASQNLGQFSGAQQNPTQNFKKVEMDPAASQNYSFSESQSAYRVTLPLSNKFEEVGQLVLSVPNEIVSAKIQENFKPLIGWLALLILIFAIFVYIDDKFLPHADYLHIAHAIVFIVASALVIYSLTQIYSEGIQGKTKALSLSIGKRLNSATELGIPLTTFAGLDNTFQDYIELNPELDSVALVEGEWIKIHSLVDLVGEKHVKSDDFFAYTTPLFRIDESSPDYEVAVSIPKKFVYAKLWRSIKNFLVLFVATALLASLFHTLMDALSRQRLMANSESGDGAHSDEMMLVLIKILYFFVVFVEGLFSSFLPQYLQRISVGNGLEPGAASLLFTVFFAAFALALVPSGNYAEKHGVKPLMVIGILLTSLSVFLMTLVSDFYAILVLRAMAGAGQGMIFIGVQSFILLVTSKGKTTQGTSIIVFGYNTGMISGTAIGALLVIYMGSEKVFLMGALVGLFILSFILFLIPDVKRPAAVQEDKKPLLTGITQYLSKVFLLFRDLQFLKTIFLIGLTTKATLTGIIVYALPLIMARMNYPQDDIGQVLMFYAAGVLVSNIFIPKIADKLGNTAKILFWGALGSGFGLLLTGLIEHTVIANSEIPFISTVFLIGGLSILGMAHGFIHAPIVAHIANTPSANVLGRATTTSIYRFLERGGHIMGPLLMGYFLLWNDYSATSFVYVGITLAILGTLFFILKAPIQKNQLEAAEKCDT